MAMMTYTLVFTVLNFLLISTLLVTYIKNYQQLRASFSLGLLLFAMIFLIQKIVSLYVFLILMHDYVGAVGVSLLILEILQTIAFSVLTWITMK